MPADLLLPGSVRTTETMSRWADAYGAAIEIRAEAAHDGQIRKTLLDATREVRQNHGVALAENQEAVHFAVKKLGMDDYRQIKERWQVVKPQILSMGWDLTEEIHFQQTGSGVLVWQGDEHGAGALVDQLRRGRTWRGPEAMLVCQFLEFVAANAQIMEDPRMLVREYLEKQGVTKENFHEHADKIGCANPWT